MSLIEGVRRKYQNEGIAELLRSGYFYGLDRCRKLKNDLRFGIDFRNPIVVYDDVSGTGYQSRRELGNKQRWAHIEPYLEPKSSVLDVGCNAGFLTSRANQDDRFVIGIEENSATVAEATHFHGISRNFGIINWALTPDNIGSLPDFDYVFLLSVYHRLHLAFGQEAAEEMLRQLSNRTKRVLFFEPASQKHKYENQNLPFEDFDKESIIEYNHGLLNDVINQDCTIEYVGASERGVHKRGKRHLFAIIF